MFDSSFFAKLASGAVSPDPDWDFETEIGEGETEIATMDDDMMRLFQMSHDLVDEFNARVTDARERYSKSPPPGGLEAFTGSLNAEGEAIEAVGQIVWCIARARYGNTAINVGVRKGRRYVALPETAGDSFAGGEYVELPPALGLALMLGSMRGDMDR